MRLSQKLEEAVFILSDDNLLGVLSEDVINDMRAGDFSTERMEEAMVGILASYVLTEEDSELVEEAIDELGESMGLDEGFLDWLKGAAKKALKAIGSAAMDAAKEGGKQAISTSAAELKKRIKAKEKKTPVDTTKPEDDGDEPEEGEEEKPKAKPKGKKKPPKEEPKEEPDEDDDDDDEGDVKDKLKDIASKALGKIADDPAQAKEILKKHRKKAAKALAKHGVKKGMKMVFGRWIKTNGGSKKEWLEIAEGKQTTKDPRRAAQFMSKREAISAAKMLPGYGPSDVIKADVMGFSLWVISDAHMNYVSREHYEQVKGGLKKEWATAGSLAGNREIDEAVRWLMDESEVTTLADGTVVYDFEGEPPGWVCEAFEFGGVAPRFRWADETRRLSFEPGDDGAAQFAMTEAKRRGGPDLDKIKDEIMANDPATYGDYGEYEFSGSLKDRVGEIIYNHAYEAASPYGPANPASMRRTLEKTLFAIAKREGFKAHAEKMWKSGLKDGAGS